MTAPPLLRAHRALAALMVGLVLALAVIAGRSRSMFGSWDIEVHGWIGNALFVLVLANLGLSVAGRASRAELGVAVAIALAVFAQIGLGYVGRRNLDAAALHVPNGVLVMALTTYQYAGLRLRARDPA